MALLKTFQKRPFFLYGVRSLSGNKTPETGGFIFLGETQRYTAQNRSRLIALNFDYHCFQTEKANSCTSNPQTFPPRKFQF